MAESITRCLPKYEPTVCSSVASCPHPPPEGPLPRDRSSVRMTDADVVLCAAQRHCNQRRSCLRRPRREALMTWSPKGGALFWWVVGGRPIIRVILRGRSTASTKHLSNASQKQEHRDPVQPVRPVHYVIDAQRHGHIGVRDTSIGAPIAPPILVIHSRPSPGGAFGPARKNSPS